MIVRALLATLREVFDGGGQRWCDLKFNCLRLLRRRGDAARLAGGRMGGRQQDAAVRGFLRGLFDVLVLYGVFFLMFFLMFLAEGRVYEGVCRRSDEEETKRNNKVSSCCATEVLD